MKMKPTLSLATAALFMLPAAHLFAQATGTSHPESDSDIVATGGSHYVKPAPAPVPCPPPAATDATVYGPYKPYVGPKPVLVASTAPAPATSTSEPVVYGPYQPYVGPGQTGSQLSTRPVAGNTLAGTVEVPTGTTFTGVLQQTISTRTTAEGTHFLAIVTVPVVRDGAIIVPAGSLIKGRITRIHGGRRISGPPQIRMQPESITMLDGTVYPISSEVSSLDHFYPARVNNEGVIVGRSSGKNTALAFGLVAASSTASGALVGGAVGAFVGLGVGTGIATAWWLRQDRLVEVPGGTRIVFTLNRPLQMVPATR